MGKDPDYVENPCKRDCPKRCIDCHGKCPDYEKYGKYRQKKRAENLLRTRSTK